MSKSTRRVSRRANINLVIIERHERECKANASKIKRVKNRVNGGKSYEQGALLNTGEAHLYTKFSVVSLS